MKNLVLVSVEDEKRDAEEEPGRLSFLCTCEKTDHIFEEE